MGFGQGKFGHIWKLENKGNYHVAEMSTSKKNKNTDQYETDWANKFVRLVGTAHQQADQLDISKNVKLGACEVTNRYDKEKNTTYTNYAIFNFEDANNNGNQSSSKQTTGKGASDNFMNIPDGIDDELPFN
ncbi:hypothetical protein [uncultured Robinsoniella sp.]|uniref:hypothetical protein n=1 Tax=uncultured Robinsoniella sp. TaxID=904190 RepID=UPI00374FD153